MQMQMQMKIGQMGAWRAESGLSGAVMLHMGMPRCLVLLWLHHMVIHLTCGMRSGLFEKGERRDSMA